MPADRTTQPDPGTAEPRTALDLDLIETLARKATPGPYELRWPNEQGGSFTVWGKQGTPPGFTDGWAIPIVASGVDSNMAYITALHPDIVLELVAIARAREQAATEVRRELLAKLPQTLVDLLAAHDWGIYDTSRGGASWVDRRLVGDMLAKALENHRV